MYITVSVSYANKIYSTCIYMYININIFIYDRLYAYVYERTMRYNEDYHYYYYCSMHTYTREMNKIYIDYSRIYIQSFDENIYLTS